MNKEERKLVDSTVSNLDKIEDLIIEKIKNLNDNGDLNNDSDLYFLADMLRLTRSYANLLEELPKIKESQ